MGFNRLRKTDGDTRIIQVGDWLFDVGKLTITKGDDELSLEPKTVDLLIYLIENADRVISKQELMDHVWRTVVSDNAVTRAIVRLRAILGDDPQKPIYIITLPRKGYRLIAPVQTKNRPVQNSRPLAWLAGALASLMIVVLVFNKHWSPDSGTDLQSPLMKLVPVTSLVGDEIDPALSPDGAMLAFAHRESESATWQVMIKKLATNEIFQVTRGLQNAWLPAWSPDGSKLAYQSIAMDYCQIYIADVNDLANPKVDKPVLNCNIGVGSGNVVWGGSELLYYSDAATVNDPFVIFSYHLLTKNLNRITSPPNSGKGDYRMQLSPDGNWLAFLRNAVYRDQTELWLYAVNSGESARITTLPVLLRALAWLPDSRRLVVANQNKQLQTVDIETGTGVELTSEMMPLFHPAAGGGKLVASVGSFHRREIWRAVGEFGTDTPVVESIEPFIVSSHSNLLARLNPQDNSVAFISERSGSPQIWLRNRDGSQHQLTRFNDSHNITALNWSPDGKRLVAAGNSRLLWVDVINQQVSFGPEDIEAVAKPVWATDNEHIYFSRKTGAEWQLFIFSTATGQVEAVVKDGGYQSKPAEQGNTIYLSKLHQPGLWQLDSDSGVEKPVGNWLGMQNFNRDWVISASEEHFYFVDPHDISSILRISLQEDSDPVNIIKLSQDTIIDFDVSRDLKTLVFSRTAVGDSDIVLLTGDSHRSVR